MNHPDYEILSAYLDGQVTDEERVRVERLLEEDAEASRLLEELREVSQAVSSLPRHTLPDDFAERIEAWLENVPRRERFKFFSVRRFVWVAAALLVALGLNYLYPDYDGEVRRLAQDKSCPTQSDKKEDSRGEAPAMIAVDSYSGDERVAPGAVAGESIDEEKGVAAKSIESTIVRKANRKEKEKADRLYFGKTDGLQRPRNLHQESSDLDFKTEEPKKSLATTSPVTKEAPGGMPAMGDHSIRALSETESAKTEGHPALGLAKSRSTRDTGRKLKSSLYSSPATPLEAAAPSAKPEYASPSGTMPDRGLAAGETSRIPSSLAPRSERIAGTAPAMVPAPTPAPTPENLPLKDSGDRPGMGGGRGVLSMGVDSPPMSTYGAKPGRAREPANKSGLEGTMAVDGPESGQMAAVPSGRGEKKSEMTTWGNTSRKFSENGALVPDVPARKPQVPAVETVVSEKPQAADRVVEPEIVVICETSEPAEVARNFDKLLLSNHVRPERQIVLDRRTSSWFDGQSRDRFAKRLSSTDKKEKSGKPPRLKGGFEKIKKTPTDPKLLVEHLRRQPNVEELVVEVDWNQAVGLLQAMEQDTRQFVSVQANASPKLTLPEPVSQFNRANRAPVNQLADQLQEKPQEEKGRQEGSVGEGRTFGDENEAAIREYNRRLKEADRRARDAISRSGGYWAEPRDKSVGKSSSSAAPQRAADDKVPARQYRIHFLFRPVETR